MKTILIFVTFFLPFLGNSQEQHNNIIPRKQATTIGNFQVFPLETIMLSNNENLMVSQILSFQESSINFGFTGKEINRWTSPEYNWFKYLKDYKTQEIVDLTQVSHPLFRGFKR